MKGAFAGNVRGTGSGVAEMEERASDSIVIFAVGKASAGEFNFPVFSTFADPFFDVARIEALEYATTEMNGTSSQPV